MIKNKKILAAAIALCSLFGARGVFAENKSSMVVSPPHQEIVLVPGEVYEGSIRVSNPDGAESDLVYSASLGSFSQNKGEDGIDDYEDVDTDTETDYNRIMDWIKLGKTSGVVGANESDTIPFTITVPKDAPAGGQYATILVQNDTDLNDNNASNVQIRSIARVASIIYADVAGETREDGKILENSIPSFNFSNPLTATSMVRNDGNVHTRAKYTLQVWPLFSNEEICTNEENISTSLILPETQRYHVETCNLPMFGVFKAKQTVEIFGEVSTIEKMVVVCPLWLLFIIVLGIVSIIIYIIYNKRKKAVL